eukprot:6828175-Pyramimonas_sp.AAC.1
MSSSTIRAWSPVRWAVSFSRARSKAASVEDLPPVCPQNSSLALSTSHWAETGRRALPHTRMS